MLELVEKLLHLSLIPLDNFLSLSPYLASTRSSTPATLIGSWLLIRGAGAVVLLIVVFGEDLVEG
jgi:hypothetical protein